MKETKTSSQLLDEVNDKIRNCNDSKERKKLNEERDRIMKLFLAQVNNRQDEGK